MKLNNKVYDILKWCAQYLFPALGTLYFALARVWNLPYGEQVVGTITAIDAFLGVILGLSSLTYDGEGTMNVTTMDDPEKDLYSLDLNVPIESLATRKSITFKVKSEKEEI